MSQLDYYKVLELESDATAEDIRLSYRKLALCYHPDKNPDDPAAVKRFQEVSQAYTILSDPEARRNYDRFGTADPMPPNPDIFEELFRHWQPKTNQSKISYTKQLDLEQAFHGKQVRFAVDRRVRCKACAGTGAVPDAVRSKCPRCDGIQCVAGLFDRLEPCGWCCKRGFVVEDHDCCTSCKGVGAVEIHERIVVKIPPGAYDKQEIVLGGRGNYDVMRQHEGDFVLTVDMQAHDRFERPFAQRPEHLLMEQTINLREALCGHVLQFTEIGGTQSSVQHKGIVRPDSVWRLRGFGMPDVTHPQERGDLFVRYRVEFPETLQPSITRALDDTLRSCISSTPGCGPLDESAAAGEEYVSGEAGKLFFYYETCDEEPEQAGPCKIQ